MTEPTTRWPGLASLGLTLAGVSLVGSVLLFGGGAGIREKTVWDWLELLLIPGALAAAAAWLQQSQRLADRRNSLEVDRRELLATFFDRMETLLLEHDLNAKGRESPGDWARGEHNEVVEIARARTLHALRNMDGARKGHILRFLIDCGILGRQDGERYVSTIRLSYADLGSAELNNAHLNGVNLWCANLGGANLRNAHLVGTNLPYAFLLDADLESADFTKANLKYAIVTPKDLERARHLAGAVMPNCETYEEWCASGKPDWTNDMPDVWTHHDSR